MGGRPGDSGLSRKPVRKDGTRVNLDGLGVEPWTASRCQQLLEQLQTRTSSLRKLISEARTMPPRQTKRKLTEQSMQQASKRVRHTYGQRRKAPVAVPLSAATPKPSVRTLRGMGKGLNSPAATVIDFPSPLWRRIRDHAEIQTTATATPELGEASSLFNPPSELLDDLQSLRYTAPEGHSRIYDAIFNWLGHLLRLTEDRPGEVQRGSLLGMCMRQVPRCIAEIEAWEIGNGRKHAGGDGRHLSDVAMDIYGQLEAFGSAVGGWKPLRLAVRVHAVILLSKAIEEGLFMSQFVTLLIRLCHHLRCNQEATRLASSWPGAVTTNMDTPSDANNQGNVRLLRIPIQRNHDPQSSGLGFEIVSTLLEEGRIAPDWLSTAESREFWGQCLEAMVTEKAHEAAAVYMPRGIEKLLLAAAKRSSTKSNPKHITGQQSPAAISAAVAAAAMTFNHSLVDSYNPEERARRTRRLIHVLDQSFQEAQRRCLARKRLSVAPLVSLAVARQLAIMDSGILDTAFEAQTKEELYGAVSAVHNETDRHGLYQEIVKMICLMARALGRTSSGPSHRILESLCTRLEELILPSWLFSGLQSDAAFFLAQRTKDLRDVAFAEKVPGSGLTGDRHSGKIFSGWRYEDGIGEWVPQSSPDPKLSLQRKDEEEDGQLVQQRDIAVPGRGNGLVQPCDSRMCQKCRRLTVSNGCRYGKCLTARRVTGPTTEDPVASESGNTMEAWSDTGARHHGAAQVLEDRCEEQPQPATTRRLSGLLSMAPRRASMGRPNKLEKPEMDQENRPWSDNIKPNVAGKGAINPAEGDSHRTATAGNVRQVGRKKGCVREITATTSRRASTIGFDESLRRGRRPPKHDEAEAGGWKAHPASSSGREHVHAQSSQIRGGAARGQGLPVGALKTRRPAHPAATKRAGQAIGNTGPGGSGGRMTLAELSQGPATPDDWDELLL